MKNDFPGIDCFALTNNDSFLMLASGGSMTLFDTTGSETTKVFMCPACKATCLLFHPQDNNVIFIGMDNSTIQIFNVHLSKHKVIAGHCRRITGLSFSTKLNVLVSSAANSEIIVWEYNDGKFIEKKKTSLLQFRDGRILESLLFNRDAYLSSNISSQAYPLVIAVDPQECRQIALGFNDGRVIVIELPESLALQQVVPPIVEGESTRCKSPTQQMVDSSSDNSDSD